MRGFGTAFLLVFLMAVASPAAAVTTEQIVALKKAGVSDAVIFALIERDNTVFTIAPEQIVALQRQGLSEALIIAMLRTGQLADEAVRAESDYANAMIAAALPPGPDILIVGHGPTRPNTYHYDGFFTNANNPYLFPLYQGSFLPYGDPYQGYVPGAVPLISPRFAPRENRLRRPAASATPR
jgi:hypothetical protein